MSPSLGRNAEVSLAVVRERRLTMCYEPSPIHEFYRFTTTSTEACYKKLQITKIESYFKNMSYLSEYATTLWGVEIFLRGNMKICDM